MHIPPRPAPMGKNRASRSDMPIYYGWDKNLVEQIHEIDKHLPILVLRKSAAKLIEYINLHGKKRKIAINKIIDIKYELSKCRPEVLAILIAMSCDPKRFVFRDTTTDSRMVFDDTAYKQMYFQVYNFRSGQYQPLPKIYINGEVFLTDHEQLMMYKIVCSLDHMRQNEYKLQQELEKLEVQKNVFEIYQSEKNKTDSA